MSVVSLQVLPEGAYNGPQPVLGAERPWHHLVGLTNRTRSYKRRDQDLRSSLPSSAFPVGEVSVDIPGPQSYQCAPYATPHCDGVPIGSRDLPFFLSKNITAFDLKLYGNDHSAKSVPLGQCPSAQQE